MKIKTTVAFAVIAASLQALPAPAQDLFKVNFVASCNSSNASRGRITTTSITDRDILANFGGTSTKGLQVVYNTSSDSLQIADSSGNILADVLDFAGGASVADSHQRDRFTFLFVPGISNAIGTAVITETASHTASKATNQRANITGKLQFALTDGTVLGSTNNSGAGFATPATNIVSPGGGFFMTSAFDDPTAKICVGTFSTSQIMRGSVTNVPVVLTNLPGTNSNIGTGTNSNTGTNSL